MHVFLVLNHVYDVCSLLWFPRNGWNVFWYCFSSLHAWAGKSSIVFAEASNPRLSEISKKFTPSSARLSLKRRAPILSESNLAQARTREPSYCPMISISPDEDMTTNPKEEAIPRRTTRSMTKGKASPSFSLFSIFLIPWSWQVWPIKVDLLTLTFSWLVDLWSKVDLLTLT